MEMAGLIKEAEVTAKYYAGLEMKLQQVRGAYWLLLINYLKSV